jgi:hypothetical protein
MLLIGIIFAIAGPASGDETDTSNTGESEILIWNVQLRIPF